MKIADITCGKIKNGSITMTEMQWAFARKLYGKNFSNKVRNWVTASIEDLSTKEFTRILKEIEKEQK